MGVYIKNMEIPPNCWWCDFCRAYLDPNQGYNCVALCADLDKDKIQTERDKGCPLVEVKPHGRLIDADALTQRYFQFPPVTFALSYAPTIIEREDKI